MWKPDVVVPEHRWRARIVWGGLLASISAYTIWQAWSIFHRLQNPSTSLEVTDDIYEFPFTMVCFLESQGCGMFDGTTDRCMSSAMDMSSVWFDGEVLEDIVVSTEASNCLGFDLRELNVAASQWSKDSIATVDMQWVQSDMASTELDYYTNIGVLISEEPLPVGNYSFLNVPYSRNLASAEEVIFQQTELTIGKTTKKDLGGDITTNYPALIMSTSDYRSSFTYDDSVEDISYGRLFLLIKQGPFSRTVVEEINPLDIGTFLGNVGGFWELLIILWGLFFIAIRDKREPELKARNFAKSIRTGKDIVTRRRSLSVDRSSASGGEERPHWESAYRGSNPNYSTAATVAAGPFVGSGGTRGGIAAAVGFPAAIPPANGGTYSDSVATRRASNASSNGSTSNSYHPQRPVDESSSSYRRPVVQDVPRRGSRSGGVPSTSHEPAPPSYEAMAAV